MGDRTPGMTYYQAGGETERRPHGMAFYGTNGTLMADRLGFEVYPEFRGRGEQRRPLIEAHARQGDEALSEHIRNFIDCVRSRQLPNADVEIGHRSTTAPHLGNISYRVGRKLQWDSERQDFRGDAAASLLLAREPRKPWNLI
jgi:hypothetical protein